MLVSEGKIGNYRLQKRSINFLRKKTDKKVETSEKKTDKKVETSEKKAKKEPAKVK